MRFLQCSNTLAILVATALQGIASGDSIPSVFPGQHWVERNPAELGLNAERLDDIARLLSGRGCVVKNGYIVKAWGPQSKRGDWASSAKPVLSTLLFFAVKEGKLKGVDSLLIDAGWPLQPKDATMTFAHLANMVSGYARPEKPGAAWAYNDFAIQLYQKSLFDRVYHEDPDAAAKTRLASLRFEDGLTWEKNRRRLSTSVRDFARLGWFWLNRGNWDGKQILDKSFFERYQKPHVPFDLPQSDKGDTNDYLKIGTYGGGSSHFSKSGPGIYGFNWWFNGHGRAHPKSLTWPDAPPDTFMSIGAGGNCSVMIPSLQMVLVGAKANWGEFDPGNREGPMNQIIRLLVESNNSVGPIANLSPSKSGRDIVTGEPKKWHNVTLTFDGPQASETGEVNPFRDYRLTVVFTRFLKTITVPGYFAADGNAAETGADAGNKWRAHFMPDDEGTWAYHASLVRGKDIAMSTDGSAGKQVAGFPISGTIEIGPTDKIAPDFRSKGLLQHVGERYWQFAQTKEVFLKGGADSPENFLAFADFDATKPTHRYRPHAGDWKPGDPTWRNGRGKNIIGALNYLHSRGVNGVYFLTMNVNGDGKDVWPWLNKDERYRYDVSKLAQWEIVFNHMERLGILLHVVHQEQENDHLLDNGELGPQRRLYYRELIARFAHHPALEWNLGEETRNTTSQIKAFAKFIHELDPYKHPKVVHTFPSQYEKVYGPLMGDRFIAGFSLQVGKMERCAKVAKEWLDRSAKSGRQWAAFIDEIGPANIGVKPDSIDPDHDDVRQHALWAPFMVGASGCEWLFGYNYLNTDIDLEDFRSRDRMWIQTTIACEFFRKYVPVRQCKPANELLVEGKGWCFAKPGKVYVVYLPNGGNAGLNLLPGKYSVAWYNPRLGGKLKPGAVREITGPGKHSLGAPPENPSADWAVLVREIQTEK